MEPDSMNQKDYPVRHAHMGDIEGMVGLLGDLFSLERDFEVDTDKQRRGLSMMVASPERACVAVALEKEAVIGMVTVQTIISTAEGGMAGVVEDLIVSTAHRGRGIGSGLLEFVHTWASRRGIRRLQLLADSGNEQGLGFYGSRGWRQTCLVCLRSMRDGTGIQGQDAKPGTGEGARRVAADQCRSDEEGIHGN
jgi:GNAT superfamily N-acetyltransferase